MNENIKRDKKRNGLKIEKNYIVGKKSSNKY